MKILIALFLITALSSCGRDGMPGKMGLVGPMGPQGAPGEAGIAGATGPQGAPGTSITVVSLCPSYGATEYPANFPEQALCIAGNLYGVYFDGSHAFLAEIVPGVYRSTSPDGCTLTVGEDCSVMEEKR